MHLRALSCLCLFLFASPALAAEWKIDPAQSQIRFSGTHAGNDFSGAFEKWEGAIQFDPQALAASHARITVDLASAKTGNATYDKTMPQADWLNSGAKAEAVFETTAFTEITPGAYKIDGKLTLREVTLPVSLDATIKIDGKKALVNAKTSLKRLDYAIGKSSDATGEWVSLEIPVEIKLVAEQQ